MRTRTTISIYDLLQSDSALTPMAGDKVYPKIVELLDAQEEMDIDFSGISYLNTAFLNAAIGQLYLNYDSDTLNKFVYFVNLSDRDLRTITRVVDGAKEYFANKRKTEEHLKKYLDE